MGSTQFDSVYMDSPFEDEILIPQSDDAPKTKRKSTAGRKLMRWDPSKDQMVLLCIEYVVARDGIPLDWNTIAEEVEPSGFLSGEAIKQHLYKLRLQREEVGDRNPPKLDRSQIIKGKKQLIASQSVRKPSSRRTSGAHGRAAAESASQTAPRKRVSTGLLYQKPKPIRKSATTSIPITSGQKRRHAEDEEFGDDAMDSVKAKKKDFGAVRKGLAGVSPRKKDRVRLTNFPEGSPTPSSPFGSPFKLTIGGMDMKLRAQERVDYTEPKIEEEEEVVERIWSNSNEMLSAVYGQHTDINPLHAPVGEALIKAESSMPVESFAVEDFPGNSTVTPGDIHAPYGQPPHNSVEQNFQGFDMLGSENNCATLSYETSPLYVPGSMNLEMNGINNTYGGVFEGTCGIGQESSGLQTFGSFALHGETLAGYGFNDDLGGEFELFGSDACYFAGSFFDE